MRGATWSSPVKVRVGIQILKVGSRLEPSSLGLIYLMVESPISRDLVALDMSMSFSICSGVLCSVGCWTVGTFSDGVFVWAFGMFCLGFLCLFSSMVLPSDNEWNLFLTGMGILTGSGMVLV